MRKFSYLAYLAVLIGLTVCGVALLPTSHTEAAPAATGATVLINIGHDNSHRYDNDMIAMQLELWGYEVVLFDEVFNDSVLADVDIVMTTGAISGNYTQAELDAFSTWWLLGNKALWVAGDSDYDGEGMTNTGNSILEAVNSSLYLQCGYVDDATNNVGGGAYRPRAMVYNNDTATSRALLNGVSATEVGVLMHGPVPVVGWNATGGYTLDNTTMDGVSVVLQFATTAYYNNHELDQAYDVYATDINDTEFAAMAVEEVGSNKIVVTGEAIWSDYKGMFGYNGTDFVEEKGEAVDNWIITNNTIHWLADGGSYYGPIIYEFVTETETETVTETETEVNTTTVDNLVTTTETETPGFEVLWVFVPILIFGFILLRRRRK